MKIILSLLLSYSLLLPGLSMPEQAKAGNCLRTELTADAEDMDTQKENTETEEFLKEQKETENHKTEEFLEEHNAIENHKEEEPKERKILENPKPKKIRSKEIQCEQEENVVLDLESQNKYASGELIEQELNQNNVEKNLKLGNNETLENIGKKGYTTELSRKIKCSHSAAAINGTIKCMEASDPLNPVMEQLKNHVVLTGNLRGKTVTKRVENFDAGGIQNTVTHQCLKVTVEDAPGIEEEVAAGPYVCSGDGYAGYAYYEHHYSYCPNTERFYKVQASHVMLACTRGDKGTPEYHPTQLKHNFNVYKLVPNKYKVSYNANGGTGSISGQNAVYNVNLTLRPGRNLSRAGYTLTGWNTKKNGRGTAYKLGQTVKNLTWESGGQVILYAQWQPNVYTILLNNQLTNPEIAGTKHFYKKYETGMFLDHACSENLTSENPIILPQKPGYLFQGYYDSQRDGKQMIDSSGKLTAEGIKRKGRLGDETWYAHYNYQVICEDYADIPCDLEKEEKDKREDPGVRLIYNSSARKVIAQTDQSGCRILLTGKKAGTRIGNFRSVLNADSASGNAGGKQSTEFSLTVPDGTAYQVKVIKDGVTTCDRLVYYKDGRFRTLAKLGTQKAKEAQPGSSFAGSTWNKEGSSYTLYKYDGCSELRDIQAPGIVQRYFRYKDVNMAYSGNGATAGANMLEYDVSLENFYQFRENGFTKERIEKKYTKDQKEYACNVKYSFQGWAMGNINSFYEKDQSGMRNIYLKAAEGNVIASKTAEDIHTYQRVEPLQVLPGTNTFSLNETVCGIKDSAKATLASKGIYAGEYINLQAMWDAFPTIMVTPGDKLEFYEGETVTKEDIYQHLTAHDSEDNDKNNSPYIADLNDKLRMVKIYYPESKNRSQPAYEKVYEEDAPEDFLLDTYYLKLEKDECVNVLVTFAVTDSTGNTTEKEIPIKVKYNYYPEIQSEDIFYYLKEEANKGEITKEALISRASAKDAEDGNISEKLTLKDFDPQELKMQTESKAEFTVNYQVTDRYNKTTYKRVKIMVWDGEAAASEIPRHYVRYISEKYLSTLEKNSIWRKPENFAYLKGILNNNAPMETWVFTHKDIVAIQDWITEREGENWKIGPKANREFLKKFAYCRQ